MLEERGGRFLERGFLGFEEVCQKVFSSRYLLLVDLINIPVFTWERCHGVYSRF